VETIALRPVRALEFDDGSHLSAGSGVVAVGEFVYVAPDDENCVGVFAGEGPGRRARLFSGSLPEEKRERKRLKTDVECLTVADGRLLALGSGSTERRRRGALWALDGSGALVGEKPSVVDFTPLYRELDAHFAELNIEGCAAVGDWLLLAQRGNGRDLANAIVTVGLRDALSGHGPAREVRAYDLGQIDGVPLTFTDLAPLGDGRVAFTAAAEDTDDPYLDGPNTGSALGLLDDTGDVVDLVRIEGTKKIEGVALARDGESLLAVDDPDDRATASGLYTLPLPSGWLT
jgi:hypothetical protein